MRCGSELVDSRQRTSRGNWVTRSAPTQSVSCALRPGIVQESGTPKCLPDGISLTARRSGPPPIFVAVPKWGGEQNRCLPAAHRQILQRSQEDPENQDNPLPLCGESTLRKSHVEWNERKLPINSQAKYPFQTAAVLVMMSAEYGHWGGAATAHGNLGCRAECR